MYRTIDLCAGIGGIRRGFERTGHFTNVLSAEIDVYAARTYEANFGDNPLNDLTSPDFKRRAGEVGCDVLLAGFPCQPFSSQGLQEGFSDPTKGTIFFDIKQIIKKTRPKAIFLENVQNIISHDDGNTMHVILDSLEKKLHYKVIGITIDESGKFVYKHSTFVRNTKNFGLPQNRPRAYFIAFDRQLYGELVNQLPNSLPVRLSDRLLHSEHLNKSLTELLEPQVDIHYYLSATYLNTLENHAKRQKENGNGFGYCIVNNPSRANQIANTILATGGSGKERNLVIQPMPNYDYTDVRVAAIVNRKKGGLNSKNIRIMTPKEWGRLQGFYGYGFVDENGVDHFHFPDNVPEGQQYKQFGNSVSIPVIETMADFLYECLIYMNRNYENVLVNFAKANGRITARTAAECLDVDVRQASQYLARLTQDGLIIRNGNARGTYYCVTANGGNA